MCLANQDAGPIQRADRAGNHAGQVPDNASDATKNFVRILCMTLHNVAQMKTQNTGLLTSRNIVDVGKFAML